MFRAFSGLASDSGSVLVRYETGMHLSYSQNFVVRNHGKRGARFSRGMDRAAAVAGLIEDANPIFRLNP